MPAGYERCPTGKKHKAHEKRHAGKPEGYLQQLGKEKQIG